MVLIAVLVVVLSWYVFGMGWAGLGIGLAIALLLSLFKGKQAVDAIKIVAVLAVILVAITFGLQYHQSSKDVLAYVKTNLDSLPLVGSDPQVKGLASSIVHTRVVGNLTRELGGAVVEANSLQWYVGGMVELAGRRPPENVEELNKLYPDLAELAEQTDEVLSVTAADLWPIDTVYQINPNRPYTLDHGDEHLGSTEGNLYELTQPFGPDNIRLSSGSIWPATKVAYIEFIKLYVPSSRLVGYRPALPEEVVALTGPPPTPEPTLSSVPNVFISDVFVGADAVPLGIEFPTELQYDGTAEAVPGYGLVATVLKGSLGQLEWQIAENSPWYPAEMYTNTYGQPVLIFGPKPYAKIRGEAAVRSVSGAVVLSRPRLLTPQQVKSGRW